MLKRYSTEKEIEEVVRGFEQCTTPKDQFTHREHLTVATWHLCQTGPKEALENMRTGLLRFLDHHAVGHTKYKEQLTVSWMTLVQDTLEKMDRSLSLVERTNNILDSLADTRLVSEEGENPSR